MMSDRELNHEFHQIIEQHKGILFKIAKTYCRNDDDRQDLLQEMMIQIWKSLGKYDNSFPINTWLYRICLNVAISFYRNGSKRNSLTIPLIEACTSLTDETSNEDQEQLNLLEKFISELNELDKALLILYLEDKNYADIAEIMGISVSNVGTKLMRIKEKIRKKFSQINA